MLRISNILHLVTVSCSPFYISSVLIPLIFPASLFISFPLAVDKQSILYLCIFRCYLFVWGPIYRGVCYLIELHWVFSCLSFILCWSCNIRILLNHFSMVILSKILVLMLGIRLVFFRSILLSNIFIIKNDILSNDEWFVMSPFFITCKKADMFSTKYPISGSDWILFSNLNAIL